jgi:hypothetical protein
MDESGYYEPQYIRTVKVGVCPWLEQKVGIGI